MTWTRVKTMAIFSLVLFPPATSWAQKQSNTNDVDSVAIKQAIGDWSDAFSHHDPHTCAMRFTGDADFTNGRGITNHGRKAIEEHFVSIFSGIVKNAHRIDSVKSIRFLTPEIASVEADWEITGSKAADGSENPVRKGLLAVVMTKLNGQWLIAVFHEFEIIATPTKY